jgi:hypothetical protein
VGPYTSVNCTLTLTRSTIRKKALLSDGEYASAGEGDDRFDTHFGTMQSIVTSSGQYDNGLFELNLRDERKLPFEYAGAVSEWQLSLPGREGELQQFNYQTISDVILHIRYTAREGGELLRKGAMANLKARIEAANAAGTTRLFSVRHEFPNDWERFKSVPVSGAVPFAGLFLTLKEEHYPFWSKGAVGAVQEVTIFAREGENTITLRPAAGDATQEDVLNNDPALGNLKVGKLNNIPLPDPVGPFSLFMDDNSMSDLWIAVKWGSS